jgi:hypothetical protein
MGRVCARAERLIDASSKGVYAVLADYADLHPRIMPGLFFSNMQVEEGGLGARHGLFT